MTTTSEGKDPAWVVYALGFIIIAAIIVMVNFSEKKDDITSGRIYAATENIIKGRLMSPGSAQFAGYGERSIRALENNLYEVTTYVDSQNGYGALIRTHFVVTLK